jgi:hypothetical protein
MSRALPAAELTLGALIFVGVWPQIVGPISVLLFSGFTVYTVQRVRNGDKSPCSCFGQLLQSHTGVQTIIRNSVLVILALVFATLTSTPAAGGLSFGGDPVTVVNVLVVAILASISLLVLYLIDLLDPRLVQVIWAPKTRSGKVTPTARGAEVRS